MRYVTFVASLVIITAAPAAAQQTPASPSDARWTPWMGCWQLSEESIEDGAQLLAQFAGGTGSTTTTPRGARVCVTPADGGATITTLMNDVPVRTETVVADGTRRPVTEEGCRGWQQTEWAKVGAHMYARTELTCGEQPLRVVSGMTTMVAGPLWVDIQSIESQGKKSVRVRRYRPAPNQTMARQSTLREQSLIPLGRKLTLEEITEASAKVPAEVLQAAVIELGTGGYDLKAKQLRELDSAGVPDTVIDLMVAMSFPKKFVVERATGGGGFSGAWMGNEIDMWPYMAMWPYTGMWPYIDDPFYYSMYSRLYSPFYSAYYAPFGYRYWGYWDPRYRYYSDVGGLVVIDSPGTGTVPPGTTPPTTGEGRVVDGRGYTRIRRADPEPIRINSGGDRGWGTSSAGTSGSSGSGSSGVSSGGYSSGGSSGGGGERVAVPRPPGEN
jgi:hypothetical protein